MCSCTLDMTYDVARFWGAINRWVRRLWRSAVAGTGDLKFGLFSLCKTSLKRSRKETRTRLTENSPENSPEKKREACRGLTWARRETEGTVDRE